MLKNKQLLLTVLVMLLAIKFLFQPWYERQAEQLEELSVSGMRLAKVNALQQIEQPLTAELAQLQQRMTELKQQLPKAASAQDMALQIQNDWQVFLEQHEIKVQLFEWVGERDISAQGFQLGQIHLRISGMLHQVALAVIMLQQQFPAASVEVSQISQSNGLSTTSQVEQQLTISLLYQLEQTN